ncbi:hypothetical protein NUW58_g4818 [Xylaria curta]|uniref:Uncharacterized protein n=1 Tax=Xylaria curta TaxID=42375 RepID=A0ACC1P4S0_9PEZI|nr:hypothetical protein NUW58_g4818 [Xylaria curta]
MDLIMAVRFATSPRCHMCYLLPKEAGVECGIETAISECVNTALRIWTPEFKTRLPAATELPLPFGAEAKINSSSTTETSPQCLDDLFRFSIRGTHEWTLPGWEPPDLKSVRDTDLVPGMLDISSPAWGISDVPSLAPGVSSEAYNAPLENLFGEPYMMPPCDLGPCEPSGFADLASSGPCDIRPNSPLSPTGGETSNVPHGHIKKNGLGKAKQIESPMPQ